MSSVDIATDTDSLQVAYVGNQGNHAYRHCKWLRKTGHDAHLYLFHTENPTQSLPELIDVELTGGYPPWIHHYNDSGIFWPLRRGKVARQIDNRYDVVITSGATGLLAAGHFTQTPVVHLTLGSEVSEFPLWIWRARLSLKWRAACFLMRRNLKRVSKVVTMGFWPELRALESLGHEDKIIIWGLPEDCLGNRSRVNSSQLDKLTAQYAECDKVYIWLARLNFLDADSIEYKGAERFLDAFEMLVQDGKHRAKAIVGARGHDVEAFRNLVTSRRLDSHVDYVAHMPAREMLTYMSLPNCVLVNAPDRRRGHIFGGVVREALSVGTPVIAGIDEDSVTAAHGPGCPILTAFDAQSCYESMMAVTAMDDAEFAQLRDATSNWARRYVHYDRRMDIFAEVLVDVLNAPV